MHLQYNKVMNKVKDTVTYNLNVGQVKRNMVFVSTLRGLSKNTASTLVQ